MDISYLNFEVEIDRLTDTQATAWGFRRGARGTHSSRTIMLEELSLLLDVVRGNASRADYTAAVMEENCLGKRTTANRKHSLQHLVELYALDSRVILFRILKDLWSSHESSRPLMAMLLALARDPLLRSTALAVIHTPHSHEFARQSMLDAVSAVVGDRFGTATLDKVVRNASSSWTQSGHFRGRGRKIRQPVEITPAATAYALLLGFAVGRRGLRLFESPWVAILDTELDELLESANAARSRGLLELKQAGSIVEVSFPVFFASFTQQEQKVIHESH